MTLAMSMRFSFLVLSEMSQWIAIKFGTEIWYMFLSAWIVNLLTPDFSSSASICIWLKLTFVQYFVLSGM